MLKQELAKAGENFVAEAQPPDITYAKPTQRAEKQANLAKHGPGGGLNLLDDAPLIPSHPKTPLMAEEDSGFRHILLDTEENLRYWTLQLEEVLIQVGVAPNTGVRLALRKVKLVGDQATGRA